MKKLFIGIDVGKEKLDFCIQSGERTLKEFVVENTMISIQTSLKGVLNDFAATSQDVLLCAEYMGQYTYPLSCACEEMQVDLWLENPAQIKQSSGVQRGKNDRLDARKIAAYALRFRDRARLFSIPEKNISTLKQLVSEHDMYISDRAKYQGQITDQKRFMSPADYVAKQKRLQRQIRELDTSIDEIESAIEQLIDGDETMKRQHELLFSIDGVGEKVAVKMIVETNAFRDFDNGRQLCCHAGVTPFKYESGSSIRSRNRVSNRADKSIKTLLHMAAIAAATRKKSGELHDYYIRKVAEGKNKISVLNAVRAKIVLRMFAVIRYDKVYEQNYQFSFA
ncbi:MAG: IS110 family transposase [Cytophagaceae bacterium]|jgi:transposase|nr:IS110 family transposase [Cytophagaceae bacterium]